KRAFDRFFMCHEVLLSNFVGGVYPGVMWNRAGWVSGLVSIRVMLILTSVSAIEQKLVADKGKSIHLGAPLHYARACGARKVARCFDTQHLRASVCASAHAGSTHSLRSGQAVLGYSIPPCRAG